ncbi:MAG: class I SAM-dependent methyltransferase [Steroidobacteraceae bacterium]
MEDLSLLIDLHRDALRQGPGGDQQTRLAIEMSGLRGRTDLHIADLGCGTGASTLVLARELDATITAVDFIPEFITELGIRAQQAGLEASIRPWSGAMESLTFPESSLDAIWAEGSIYNMGFTAGIQCWRRFLKPGGVLAVSELTWLTSNRPAELSEHWMREYPEVATASSKMATLETSGYTPIGYFVLPAESWLDHYYRPMQARFEAFLDRHQHSSAAKAIVDAELREISLYERYSEYFSYGYYLAKRIA